MQNKKIQIGPVTLVLGAGASRGVSYARKTDVASPLDRDFFDLLQRLEPRDRDEAAVGWVLEKISTLPFDYRRSLERTFYTLHLRSYLRRKLSGTHKSEEEAVVSHFARAVVALLRKAHGTHICENHNHLLRNLGLDDAVISFNYDLVIERALSGDAAANGVNFSPAIYRLEPNDQPTPHLPKILKLHGSVNWELDGHRFRVRTSSWDELKDTPGYRGYSGEGTKFPIFLPFWDKEVTKGAWLPLWKQAHLQLKKTKVILCLGIFITSYRCESARTLHGFNLGWRHKHEVVRDRPIASNARSLARASPECTILGVR